MKDKKVIETLRDWAEEEAYIIHALHHAPVLFFAEAVALSRRDRGVSIEDIVKCFKIQFSEDELSELIREFNKQ